MKRKSMYLLLAMILMLCGADCTAEDFDATFLTRPGDPVPTFGVTMTDNTVLKIEDLRGRIVLINFFATWCPPCKKELPHLEKEIWAKYKDNPRFSLIVIGREHKVEEVRKFKEENKLTLPMGADPHRDIYKQFATQTIPRNYIIGRDGRILYQSQGFSEEEMGRLIRIIEENRDK